MHQPWRLSWALQAQVRSIKLSEWQMCCIATIVVVFALRPSSMEGAGISLSLSACTKTLSKDESSIANTTLPPYRYRSADEKSAVNVRPRGTIACGALCFQGSRRSHSASTARSSISVIEDLMLVRAR
jgi:hypothetical protein